MLLKFCQVAKLPQIAAQRFFLSQLQKYEHTISKQKKKKRTKKNGIALHQYHSTLFLVLFWCFCERNDGVESASEWTTLIGERMRHLKITFNQLFLPHNKSNPNPSRQCKCVGLYRGRFSSLFISILLNRLYSNFL